MIVKSRKFQQDEVARYPAQYEWIPLGLVSVRRLAASWYQSVHGDLPVPCRHVRNATYEVEGFSSLNWALAIKNTQAACLCCKEQTPTILA